MSFLIEHEWRGNVGNDITEQILADKDYIFLLIVSNLSKSDKQALEKANDLAKYCATGKCKFLALTAATQAEADRIRKQKELVFDFYQTDETTLKTMNRANPGMMLIRDGKIVGQWHYNDFPRPSQLGDNLMSYMVKNAADKAANLRVWLLLFILFYAIAQFQIIELSFDRQT